MATTTPDPRTTTSIATPPWLSIELAWRLALAFAAAAGGVALLADRVGDLGGVARWSLVAGLAVVAGSSAWSASLIRAARHRGRAIGIVVDYLLAVVFGFLTLQEIGAFIGFDSLGETFHDAVFMGLIVLAGWILYVQADRFGDRADSIRRIGRWVMIGGVVVLALAVRTVPAIGTFFTRIVEPRALALFVMTLLSAASFVYLRRRSSDLFFGTTRSQAEAIDGFLYASPNVLGFLAFFAGPLLFSFFVSFTSWDGLTEITWVGLDNYIQAFSVDVASISDGQGSTEVLRSGYVELFRAGDLVIGVRDREFWLALRNIVIFGLVAVPLSVVPALLLAALLNQKIPGMKLFRAIYFIPAVAGVVGITLIWKQLYNVQTGFINYGLQRLGDAVSVLPLVEWTAPQPEWLSSSETALLSVIIVFSWSVIGFNTVLFVAGMQGIPPDLYEAASIDGAGPWTKFRRVTVPLLAPTTTFVVATTTILALQLFNEPFILFQPQLPPSGPNNAASTPVVHLYQEAFNRFNQGYASALAWVLFAIIFGITLFYFRRQRGEDAVLGA